MTDKANKGAAKTPDLVWWPLGTLIAAYALAEKVTAIIAKLDLNRYPTQKEQKK